MGQLIAIFEVLVGLCVTHEEYRALVESSFDARVLDDDVAADRLADWQLIQAPEIGELIGEVLLQRVYLVRLSMVVLWAKSAFGNNTNAYQFKNQFICFCSFK